MQTYDIFLNKTLKINTILFQKSEKSCKTTSENRQEYKQNRCQILKIWLPKV